jgi:hypothetical protein
MEKDEFTLGKEEFNMKKEEFTLPNHCAEAIQVT